MEIITELEKGERELDLITDEDLEDTKKIDVQKINEELEKTKDLFVGVEDEQRQTSRDK